MSKRTRANFMAAEKLREENRQLQRQINWLLSEITYISDNPRKDWAMCSFCPSNCSDLGCEFTWYNGVTDRPACETCWREHARRGAA